MCGITAIYQYHYAAPAVDLVELEKINVQMSRRGPDGEGAWLSSDGRVGLAHRRLSIIDVSDAGAQPMHREWGDVTISYNGELYNYKSLRAELESHGYIFRSDSDTEVILAAYHRFGLKMFERFRGMYAFVIWDNEKRELLLARDPYGIKPLFYANDGWGIRVASQVRALQSSGAVSSQCDAAGVVGFFLTGSVPGPFSIYRDIHELPPGSFMRVNERGVSEPQPHSCLEDAWSVREVGETLQQSLMNSVSDHLVSDVPVGIFLSSGLDSMSLLAFTSQLRGDNADINTVTLRFKEHEGTPEDESVLAREMAQHFRSRHYEKLVDQDEFEEDLPQILTAMDQPTVDGINTWFVAKTAREAGLKVALSGIGGDELFGSYPSFVDLPKWKKWLRYPGSLPLAGLALEQCARFNNGLPKKAFSMLRYGSTWGGCYLLRRGVYMPHELTRFLDPAFVNEGLTRLNLLERLNRNLDQHPGGDFGVVSSLESKWYLRNQLLRDADWAGMAHSVEVRVPYVDFSLFNRVAPHVRGQSSNKKHLLAETTTGLLPNEVLTRPKSGFTTPIEDWMKSDSRQASQHWSRGWLLQVADSFGVQLR